VVTVVPLDAAQVAVTGGAGEPYTITVTDTAWAAAHPGTQILVTAL
jgi:hypothetical protein